MIYPEWRGYDYILVGDQIVVVDPRTSRDRRDPRSLTIDNVDTAAAGNRRGRSAFRRMSEQKTFAPRRVPGTIIFCIRLTRCAATAA